MDNAAPTGPALRPLRIGDTAPDFEARSTAGPVRLSDFRGRWLVLFSHPADFTPVCTTEFVALAREAAAFDARDCALMALSVDSLFSHFAWLRMIRDRFDVEVRFPIVEDPTLVVGRAYGMVCAQDSDSATVRTTFFIDPAGTIRALSCYPASVGRSIPEMLRTLDALQAIDAAEGVAPANWQAGDALLRPPAQDIDEVFAAEGQADWFLREATPRKGERR
ncbi:peroxiredoxin [Alteriqipengyuania flavescens]|uniref:peroxiredoxin n=1 Tax=Alteriqipengyuania flavescens TaxID=3053610 RepID=UPI0025B3626A|nr:peroxiredoxin [Alteriqipengyuania flavescens]WJY19169.1 peroxiredoxin [Alteriqipengyuania flavescens]WJY25109.1 peroxiredoxin [Alteriqipengyuania flavescens]